MTHRIRTSAAAYELLSRHARRTGLSMEVVLEDLILHTLAATAEAGSPVASLDGPAEDDRATVRLDVLAASNGQASARRAGPPKGANHRMAARPALQEPSHDPAGLPPGGDRSEPVRFCGRGW
ncbi:hypothetical protein MMB17_18880 [Methylobacterium organophilum]|uniref:hypothetical protein n=1 Tax=Methylobacterium organophilum TaxID=410 RepID=UPI001F133E24|nr:hypothetical protein [Methylobacterium organophilum]UMY16721.1 hypothetical protein MMB17_18880 [Methylobacterium organophilum]